MAQLDAAQKQLLCYLTMSSLTNQIPSQIFYNRGGRAEPEAAFSANGMYDFHMQTSPQCLAYWIEQRLCRLTTNWRHDHIISELHQVSAWL